MKPGSTPGQASTFLPFGDFAMTDSAQQAARFQNLATRLLRQARRLDEGSEMTSAQYSALSTLYNHPGIPLTDLARLEYVSHPTMSRIVAALDKAGWIARVTLPGDRRSHSLSLSEAGRSAYEKVYARRLHLISALLARLKPETVADLVLALEDLPALDSRQDT